MTFRPRLRALAWSALLAVGALPGAAGAHELGPAAGPDWAAGFAHPFSGLDHQLAMLAIGLWAALGTGRSRLCLPVGFVAGAGLGLLHAGIGPAAPVAPALLAASVLTLGICVALVSRSRLEPALVLAIGVLHGHAHASDLAVATSPTLFAAGFLAATALLHALGFLAVTWIPARARRPWTRAAGGAIALAGAGLVAVAIL